MSQLVSPYHLHVPGTRLWYQGRQFEAIDHPANRRRNSKISVIWNFGFEYMLVDDQSKHFWRCGHCRGVELYAIHDSSKSVLRHLKREHPTLPTDDDSSEIRSMSSRASSLPPSSPPPIESSGIHQTLVTSLAVERFRMLLLRWIVTMHLALSVVANDQFRALIVYVAPSLKDYLVSAGNTIRRWILQEYEKGKKSVQAKLAESKSRVHLSFDLWSAPFSKQGYCAVVAHWLDEDDGELSVRNSLIALPRMKGSHTGENIADELIAVIEDYDLASRVGFFIADNVSVNDKAIRLVLERFQLGDFGTRRVRCMGHIVNLAAKAFIFGQDLVAFEDELVTIEARQDLEAQRRFWRKKGAVGKLHNLCVFAKSSSQRRDALMACMSGIAGDDCDSKSFLFLYALQTLPNSAIEFFPHHIFGIMIG